MYPMNISRTIRLICESCLKIKSGDRVIILGFTEENQRIAAAIASEAHVMGAEAGVILIPPPLPGVVEPPSFVAAAMMASDLVVTLGLVDFGHTMARKQATAAGVSYAYIPDLMNDELTELGISSEDLMAVRERTLLLAERVTNARTAKITTAAGTDLTIPLDGRPGLSLYPVFDAPGHFAIVPFYAEVACAPLENKAHGVAVFDGTVVGMPGFNGVLPHPIRCIFEKGRVVKMEGGPLAAKLESALKKSGENTDSLAELGIGSNHCMRDVLIGNRRDNGIFGHIHLALGRNTDLGGVQMSPIHMDLLLCEARLELDGELIIENRQLMV